MVLRSMIHNGGPRPFKFFNCWLENPGLVQNLSIGWKDDQSKSIHSKFKNLRSRVKEWNSVQGGNIDTRIKCLEGEQEEADVLNKSQATKHQIRSDLEGLYKIKCSMLCQKSRINWNLKGEKNTKFFHNIINRRKRQNAIMGLEINGACLDKPEEIKNAIFSHFKGFFETNLDRCPFNLPDDNQKREMVEPFTVT